MAITILKQPDSNHPNLLGLPIEFELYSDNVMAYDGNVAEFTYMHWQNFPTNNKKLRISFLNYNLEFTCSDNPDLSNNEISNSVAGAANEGEAWANTVASELNQHPIIAEHWEVISLGGGQDAFGPWARLKYRAKYKSGALYMPYFSNEAGYINLMRTDAVEGQTPQRKSSFYIVADIYDEYNNRINSLPLVPDSQSKVKFDAAPSLKHLIETKLRVSNSLTGKEFGTYKFFKIKYYERWGKGNWSPIQTSSTYYYMYGNLSHLHRAALNDYNLTWHEDLQTSRSFLTDRATSSYIRLNQYLRFGFLFQNNVSNEKVYYRFSNENGDVVSGSVPLQAPANLFEIWYLNIHHLIESIPFNNYSTLLIIGGMALLALVMSNFMSNTATANLLMPLLAVLGTSLQNIENMGGVSSIIITVALACSIGMVLPISTPPNALAHGTGFIKTNQMARTGVIIGIVGLGLAFVTVYILTTLNFIK